MRTAVAAAGVAAALTACGPAPVTGPDLGAEDGTSPTPTATLAPADGTLPAPTITLAPADRTSGPGNADGTDALDPFAAPLPIGDSTAAPTEFTVDDQFPGVAIHLVTGGGIHPWDVQLRVARDHMVGPFWDRMPGGAWQITVPEDAAPLRSGSTLTLPYDADRLDGFPEQDLRIFCYDPRTRSWRVASDNQTVDVDSHTVTTAVAHLSVYASVYAVLSIRPSD